METRVVTQVMNQVKNPRACRLSGALSTMLVLNYAQSWLTIPNTSYLFFIILLSILCILVTVCVSPLSYFITILYIFTILCIAYSQLFLPHPTESKSYPYLYFTLLLTYFLIVIFTYNRFVSYRNTVIFTTPD